ncbi:hypothetical protein [Algoriphagus sp. Y33]|uniref:hypothetical protein n=1 Tax=Algoriphagus sp. Y33 TaxID=2772483 RepID=UPI00178313B1|nr:hypothetical protein [Algoriphagus sp. Y33]
MFKISLSDANSLVDCFLKEFQGSKFQTIGGVINKSSFINMPFVPFKGTMCWFGLEGENKLKLFFEPNVDYIPTDVPFYPISEDLWDPFFLLDQSMISAPGGGNPINNIKFTISQGVGDTIISRKNCLNHIADFSWKFPKNGIERYNNYSLGFFETNNFPEVSGFLNSSEVHYIAYFFGLDMSPHYKGSNRIRIILVGLDSKGNMLLPAKNDSIEEPYLLQYSWPPKP